MRADYSLIGTARHRSGLRLDRLSDLIPYALETDWPVEVPVLCERVSVLAC
jgi:hypothetical protein